jgi:glycosyltransferase involved in cell wall biosynthesis
MGKQLDDTWEPIVAIGMPTYNRAAYLKMAVDSFLAQTYKNVVVVICDNASTDGTRALCEGYLKTHTQKIKYIRNPKTLTRDGNATFALHQIVATGDLIMMTSDDDLAEPEFIEECVKALCADPAAGMAITNHDTIYFGTDKVDKKYINLHVPQQKGLYERLKQYILFYSHDERSFCMSGVFHRAIVENEKFEDKTESDVSFALRCLSRGYFVAATDRVLFHKGVIPGIGKESIRTMPIGITKIRKAIITRLRRALAEFGNMGFILFIPTLSAWQKVKLIGWDLFVVGRLFMSIKV